jgi:hypothetical protein
MTVTDTEKLLPTMIISVRPEVLTAVNIRLKLSTVYDCVLWQTVLMFCSNLLLSSSYTL